VDDVIKSLSGPSTYSYSVMRSHTMCAPVLQLQQVFQSCCHLTAHIRRSGVVGLFDLCGPSTCREISSSSCPIWSVGVSDNHADDESLHRTVLCSKFICTWWTAATEIWRTPHLQETTSWSIERCLQRKDTSLLKTRTI